MENFFGITLTVKSPCRLSLRYFFLAILAMLVLSGCGSNGGGAETGVQTSSGDHSSPSVTTTSIAADSASVSVNTVVSSTFSEAMDTTSLDTATFTLRGPSGLVAGTVAYDTSSNTATFTPQSPLNYDTRYTATITTGVKDVAKNPLAIAYSWNFTTEHSPALPPDTLIDNSPPATTKSTAATFIFHSSPSGATFECMLDGGSYAPCNNPQSYTNLAVGSHVFSVRAVDAAGNDSTPATFSWTINSSQWAQTAVPEGGRINALVVDPTTPGSLYAGTDRGIFKTLNGGSKWSAVSTDLTIGALLAVDPTTIPATLYAGGGRSGIGTYKSTDGGTTWSKLNTVVFTGPDSYFYPIYFFVEFLTVDPTIPGSLYAGGSSGSGLFKSTDSGVTWSVLHTVVQRGMELPYSFRVFHLAIDPTMPGTLYAGTNDGLYKSTDGGATWNWVIHSGLFAAYVSALAVDATTPGTLYVSTNRGLFKSTDRGTSWNQIVFNINPWLFDTRGFTLALDPTTPGTLYVGNQGTDLIKSVDGGSTWTIVNTSPYVHGNVLVVDPTTPGNLYMGTKGSGVFKSTDGSTTWSEANTGLTAVLVSKLVATASALYALGTYGGVYKSTNSGAAWRSISTGLTGLIIEALATDPNTPGTLYARTYNYNLNARGLFKSTDDGARWDAVNPGLPNLFVLGFTWRVDPVTRSTLYAATYDSVFRSMDSGETWNAVNIDLTSSRVFTLVVSPSGTLFVGTDGGVSKSDNRANTWSAINTGLTNLYVKCLVMDSTTPNTLYAGTYSGLFKSMDGGETWNGVGFTNAFVGALAVDPVTPGTLYAATSNIIYTSADSGSTWKGVTLGVNTLAVTDLVYVGASSPMLFAVTANGNVYAYPL